MKLPSKHFRVPANEGPTIKAVHEVATSTLVGICIGSVFFLFTVAAVGLFCYGKKGAFKSVTGGKSRRLLQEERPVVFRRPTAVRSPSSGGGPGGLKRSPSGSKTPSPSGLAPQPPPQQECPLPATLEVQQATTVLVEHEKIDFDKEPADPVIPEVAPPCDQQQQQQQQQPHNNDAVRKLGKLHFKLKYNAEKYSLQVTILRCTDLPAKDLHSGTSDPYVKLQLLPEKQHKVKTRVLRKTLNPTYDEEFTFYGLNPHQFAATTLHFVVLSFDRYSRDDVIGEVIVPLRSVPTPRDASPLVLCQEITPRTIKVKNQGRGELLVSLCYQPAANRLTVVVLKARGLPKMDLTGVCDPYVKLYLLYNGQRIAKKKTHVKKRTTSPVWNESFVFEVPYPLEAVSLELLVLDWDRVTKNEVVGRLVLGPGPGAQDSARQHWLEVAESPRRQIAEWHRLIE